MENIFFDLSKLKYLGKNAIIGKTVRIRKPELVSIGDYSIIDDFTYIPCELVMGNYSHIGANTSFIGGSGRVEIGSFVNIAPGCQIVTGSNHFTKDGLTSPAIPTGVIENSAVIENVVINDHVLLGVQTVILPGVILPEGVSIGAMSLVKKSVYNPWSLYAGIPAKLISVRDSQRMKEDAEKVLNFNEQDN